MKVVSFKNLPTRLPIYQGLTLWLVLDRVDAPSWAWGAVGTLFGLLFLVALYIVCTQKQVEILPVEK